MFVKIIKSDPLYVAFIFTLLTTPYQLLSNQTKDVGTVPDFDVTFAYINF